MRKNRHILYVQQSKIRNNTYYKFHASNNPLDVDNYLKNIPV